MKRFLIMISVAFGLVTMNAYASDYTQTTIDIQKSYTVKGVVVAIDKVAIKVKLKHEAIPELNWPAMTMFFSLADKSQLETLVVGNKVEFQLIKTSSGMPLITEIKAIK